MFHPHSPLATVNLVSRAAQLAADLLVVVITGWYTYQSCHIWKDSLKFGRSLSSLLVYNGELFSRFSHPSLIRHTTVQEAFISCTLDSLVMCECLPSR